MRTTSPRIAIKPTPAAPIVKWAGGKGRLVPQLRALLPAGVERMRHLEPFAGGAALFFAQAPDRALLCDCNPDLIALYRTVRDTLPALLRHLQALALAHDRTHYYAIRKAYNARQHTSTAQRAAWFLYLNKTCFNGLHRVNRRGEFNVPMGRYENPRILDAEALTTASTALQHADLRCGDFATTLRLARPGDFVYLDPPYDPASRTANFTAYAKGGFGMTDQVRLSRVFAELARRGCYVMLSSSDTTAVRQLYAGYPITKVTARRAISCNADDRGSVTELVIRNFS